MRRTGTIQERNMGTCENTQRSIRTHGCKNLILHSYRQKSRAGTGVPGEARCDLHAHTETRAVDSVTC